MQSRAQIVSSNPEVFVGQQITAQSIQNLIDSKICAIRIPNFVSQSFSKRMAQWFLQHKSLEVWPHEHYKDGVPSFVDYGVHKVGTPFNLTYGKKSSDPLRQQYYKDALPMMDEIRQACLPDSHPIISFLRDLQFASPAGAGIAQFEGQPMFAGIGRITFPGHSVNEQPHFDALPAEFGLVKQFSANIYLQVSDKGGELELWNSPPLRPDEISKLNPNRDWRKELPPSFLLAQSVGDLVMFDTRRPHALRQFEGIPRVAIQVFIGYIPGRPLLLWN